MCGIAGIVSFDGLAGEAPALAVAMRDVLAHRGPDEAGLHVDGVPAIEFSASHFTAADLFAARHTYELTARPEVYLNLDLGQRGLGTASCGPDTLPQYCLLESVYRFGYRLSVK